MNASGDFPGVVSCVAALISAFRDGDLAVQQLKDRRLYTQASPPPSTLEESIAEAPREIEREKRRGFERFGKMFEKGDYPAVVAIQQITIDVRSLLLEQLREAINNDAVVDFTPIVDVADTARENAIAALTALRRRLMQVGNVGQTNSVSAAAEPNHLDVPAPSLAPPPLRPVRHYPSPPVQPYSPPSYHAYPDAHHSPFMQNAYPAQWDYMPPPTTLQPDSYVSHVRSPSQESRTRSDAAPATSPKPNEVPNRRHSSVMGFFRRSPSRPENERQATQDTQKIKFVSLADQVPVRSGGRPAESMSRGNTLVDVDEDPFESRSRHSSSPEMQRNDTRSSTATEYSVLSTAATSVSSMPIRAARKPSNTVNIIPPGPENDYLGFCKGASKLQNGDKSALIERKDFRMSASNDVSFPSCSKCQFKGHEYTQLLRNKVRVDEARNLKYRWTFLAKSHVKQKTVTDQNYSYQCLFCIFLGVKNRIIYNESSYLDHVSQEHRWHELDDVVLNRTRCVNDRISKNEEKWDINLYPLSANEREYARKKQDLSENLGIGMPSQELAA